MQDIYSYILKYFAWYVVTCGLNAAWYVYVEECGMIVVLGIFNIL